MKSDDTPAKREVVLRGVRDQVTTERGECLARAWAGCSQEFRDKWGQRLKIQPKN